MAKRMIIEAYASMWPREICDLRDGGRLFIRDFDKPGVYVLYREDVPYYIGKATRLGPRIWQHSNQPADRYYHFWNMFSMFVVSHEKYLAEVEDVLICAMPTANGSKPKIPRVMPSAVLDLIQLLRRHRANPLTQSTLEKALSSRRKSPKA